MSIPHNIMYIDRASMFTSTGISWEHIPAKQVLAGSHNAVGIFKLISRSWYQCDFIFHKYNDPLTNEGNSNTSTGPVVVGPSKLPGNGDGQPLSMDTKPLDC